MLSKDLCLLFSFFTNIICYFLFLLLFFYLAMLNDKHCIPVGLDYLFICLFLFFSLFLNEFMGTSFYIYSSLFCYIIFCKSICPSRYCSSILLSLSSYLPLICSMMTSFPLKASSFFRSSISFNYLIFFSLSISINLSFFFSWILYSSH